MRRGSFLFLPGLLSQRVTVDSDSVLSQGYFDFGIGLRIDFDEGYLVQAVVVYLDGVSITF